MPASDATEAGATSSSGLTPVAAELERQLIQVGNADDARAKAQYLQAFPGGYAEGDVLVGVRVPQVRALARSVKATMTIEDASSLLDSSIHEARLLGVIELVELFKPKRTPQATRDAIVQIVLTKTERLNNWDLIDTVAGHTLGVWLADRPVAEQDEILNSLAASPLVWRRRLAMVSTQGLMRSGDTRQAFRLAAMLLSDQHDLMHKAVGWMLREAGQIERIALDAFLDVHAATMPRTALRYALEKHEKSERDRYMALGR